MPTANAASAKLFITNSPFDKLVGKRKITETATGLIVRREPEAGDKQIQDRNWRTNDFIAQYQAINVQRAAYLISQ